MARPTEWFVFIRRDIEQCMMGEDMMRKRVLLALALISSAVNAEAVWQVTQHSDGSVYFQTSSSCRDRWCKINPNASSEIKKNYFALLLASKLAGNELIFEWAGVTVGSDGQVPVYSFPSYIMLK